MVKIMIMKLYNDQLFLRIFLFIGYYGYPVSSSKSGLASYYNIIYIYIITLASKKKSL